MKKIIRFKVIMKHAPRAQIVALIVGIIVVVVYVVFYLFVIPAYFSNDKENKDEYRQLASYIFGICMTICTFIIPNIGHTLDTLVDNKT